MQEHDQVDCSYFLFINAGSGGNLGKDMLADEVEKYQFRMQVPNQTYLSRIDAYVYNMRENRDAGFKKLKHMNDQKHKTVAVVCGGDGTIMWVVSEFNKYGINPQHTPLAIIPLGTGNDFSRSLGWGGSPFLKWNVRQLKQSIRDWLEAEEVDFDLWDVSATVFENGSFEKVSEQKDIVVEGNRLSKSFCNYFSFGIDGQIGYSFDKLRTKNKLANFAVYGAVGALNQLQKPMPINVYVESLYETPCPDDDENYKKKGRLIFDTSNKRIHIYGQNGEGVINQEQKNILALNIDSYTGGTTGIWKNAKSILKGEEKTLPSPSDGLIEVVSFDSGLGIAMEKSIGGFSKKIIQSPGPLRYDFIRYKDDSHCTYLQIDGEFFRINHPKTIVLKKSEIVKGGKIRVLRKKENNNFFNPLINQIKDIQAFFG